MQQNTKTEFLIACKSKLYQYKSDIDIFLNTELALRLYEYILYQEAILNEVWITR
jgi:hypothetical protein